ncbi:MAG: META domain-containing protein [Pseudomonadota bacterium]
MPAADPNSLTTLRGEVFYLDRRALSDRAELILELSDGNDSTRILASQSTALNGQQVPVAFELPLPVELDAALAMRLRAAIAEPDGAVRIGSTEAPFSLEKDSDVGTIRLSFLDTSDEAAPFRCGDAAVHPVAIGDRLILIVDGQVDLLQQIEAASGSRYRNDRVEFWWHHDEGRLTIEGEERPVCRSPDDGAQAPQGLADTRWEIIEIGGEPIVPDSQPDLQFSAEEQRVAGNASCNRFGGPYELNDGRLNFGPLMMTLMACPNEAINDQEQRYLEALEQVDGFRLTADGELQLFGNDGVLLRARPVSGAETAQ